MPLVAVERISPDGLEAFVEIPANAGVFRGGGTPWPSSGTEHICERVFAGMCIEGRLGV